MVLLAIISVPTSDERSQKQLVQVILGKVLQGYYTGCHLAGVEGEADGDVPLQGQGDNSVHAA